MIDKATSYGEVFIPYSIIVMPVNMDNNGIRDEHLPVGRGLIDHELIVRELRSINYDRTITLEVFTNSADAKASAEVLRKLWSEI